MPVSREFFYLYLFLLLHITFWLHDFYSNKYLILFLFLIILDCVMFVINRDIFKIFRTIFRTLKKIILSEAMNLLMNLAQSRSPEAKDVI